MKLYAAPMEGITTWVWRGVHREIFGGADGYMTPFLSPNANMSFQYKEIAELSHREADVVPQLLANRAEYFLWGMDEAAKYGYETVNLNMGCPSGTVVAKRKGSGLLGDPALLEALLDGIYTARPDAALSVKTRIGRYDAAEWPRLLEIYNKYPLRCLIVHPRLQREMYLGSAHRDAFTYARQTAKMPLIYNGDITDPDDPMLREDTDVMIGRGLLMDPALLRRIRGGPPAGREELIAYHDALLQGYLDAYGSPMPALYKMRGLWVYLGEAFAESQRYLKVIFKAKDMAAYKTAANAILYQSTLTGEG